MSAELVLKAVADPTRLKILSSLMERPKFVEEIAKELNIAVSTASFHLKKLQAVGFVMSKKEQYYQTYTLNSVALKTSLMELVGENREMSENFFKNEVVEECFSNGKLVNLPVQIKKREVICEEIIKLFKRGKKYSDKEANLLIADVYDDFIVLKNELIDFGLLIRDGTGLVVSSKPVRKNTKFEKTV